MLLSLWMLDIPIRCGNCAARGLADATPAPMIHGISSAATSQPSPHPRAKSGPQRFQKTKPCITCATETLPEHLCGLALTLKRVGGQACKPESSGSLLFFNNFRRINKVVLSMKSVLTVKTPRIYNAPALQSLLNHEAFNTCCIFRRLVASGFDPNCVHKSALCIKIGSAVPHPNRHCVREVGRTLRIAIQEMVVATTPRLSRIG